MKTRQLLFFLLIITGIANSQTTINGIVKDSIGAIQDAHVVNLSSKLGTYSNENGEFRLLVKLGDSLQISSVQHITSVFYITPTVIKNKFLEINLNLQIYSLEEFELKQHDLTGFLGIDINSIPKDNTPTFDAVSLGLPNAGKRKLTQIERKLFTATSSNGGLPLDFLINTISGRIKRLKKQAQILRENRDVEFLYKNYRFFIQDYYKISEDDVNRFLLFCVTHPTYKKSILNNELELIPFLKKQAELFLAYNKK